MSQSKNELLVENFNLKYPVGSEVIVTLDDRSTVKTKTTYRAYLMCGVPVVGLEDISGAYALERVKGAK